MDVGPTLQRRTLKDHEERVENIVEVGRLEEVLVGFATKVALWAGVFATAEFLFTVDYQIGSQ